MVEVGCQRERDDLEQAEWGQLETEMVLGGDPSWVLRGGVWANSMGVNAC